MANPQSVEKAETILANLKAEAKKAYESDDAFLMGIMTELIKVASPIVTRAIAAQHRAERATINRKHKELRAKVREQGTPEDDSFPSDR